MPQYTLTYSERDKGWTSFHSFIPEAMVYMDNNYYTFKNGQLYKHYSNATRNNYYGVQYDTTITSILNDSPLQAKMFKTVQLNSNKPWRTEITTDMTTGFIDSTAYVLKEGDYYAYIKRVAGNTDLSLMSAQGIGNVTTVTGTSPGSIVFDFAFDIGSIIAIGDVLYRDNSGIELIGTITALTSTSITVAATSITPVAGDFILYLKNAQAESYGSRGYYAELKLTYTGTDSVELFAIDSEIFKSFP